MRRHRLLRNSSTQSLCIFCALRLSGQVAPATTPQQRLLHSSRRPNQQAAAQAPQQQPAPQAPEWTFDPNSTLSPSEQREKAHRQAIRREREEREAAERQRFRHEEEKRQHERQIREFQQREAAQRARQRDEDARRQEAQRLAQEARDRQAAQRTEQNKTAAQLRRAQKNEGRRLGSAFRTMDVGANGSTGPADVKDGRRDRQRGDAAESKSLFGQQHVPQVQSAQSRSQSYRKQLFRDEQAPRTQRAQSRFPDERQRQPRLDNTPQQRVSMPSFGESTQTEEVSTGWGRGSEIKAVQYKTDEQIREEEIAAMEREKRLKEEKREEARRAAEAQREEARRREDEKRQRQTERFASSSITRPSRSPTRDQGWRTQSEGLATQPQGYTSQAQGWPTKSQGYPAQSEGYPPPQAQGYPPSQSPGYPPPQSPGYPTQQPQGYASQSPGYPTQSQGYPTQSQGYPPPPVESSFDVEGQYRATPFKPTDYQSPAAPMPDESWENTWQHLAPRRKELASSPPPPQRAQPNFDAQRQASLFDDELTIDQKFQEHRRQRDMRAQSPFVNPNIADMPAPPEFLSGPSRKAVRCARCLQPGHHARDCTGPLVCSRCRQPGHQSRDCQNPAADPRQTGGQSRVGRQPLADRGADVRESGNFFRKARTGDAEEAGTERSSTATEGAERTFYRPTRGVSQFAETVGEDGLARRPRQESAQRTQEDRGSFDSKSISSRDRAALEEEPEDDDFDARRSRRSRRGFVEPDEEVEKAAAPKPFERRKEGRAGRRRDSNEDADDEALAAREERVARKAAKKAQEKSDQDKKKAARAAGQRAGGGTQVHLPEFVSVSNLAQQLGIGYDPFVQRLEKLGYDDVFPGKVLNRETSGMIAMEYDFDPVYEGAGSSGAKSEEEERDLKPALEVEDTTFLPTRPPVVTIMGHVDHGKTTILDYLRRTSVAAGEAGGITQHIGAFSVPLSASGRTITFLDTPGHAAFMSMRQRGANVTDIVILVVAADDSVKPQTLESIRCAREAGVPMIVAVNKVDKPEADVQKVKNDLSRHGVEIEDFGGEVQVVEVSGKTGQGLDALEENVVTLSEILDHRSDTEGAVEGWVLEATTKRAGRVATVLVRRGTLRPGAILVAGKTWARVRSLRDERDQNVMEVGPGMPVEVDGWRDQPVAGDEVLQASGEQKATDVVAYRLEQGERLKMEEDMEAINETRRAEQERRKAAEKAAKAAAAAAEGADPDADVATTTTLGPTQDQEPTGQQTLPFIVKADVSGSAEAVAAYIPSLTSPLIAPDILSSTVGAINESDIELASASGGHIIAFNLPKNEDMRGLAESKGVMVLENNIIYRVLEQVREVLEARLPAIVTQKVVGEAEVGAVFEIGVGGRKKLKIAGCKVRNGAVARNARVRVTREGEKVYDGTITSLKNVKKDVPEMRKGTECGMGFEGWEGFQEGDQIQTYEEVREKRKL